MSSSDSDSNGNSNGDGSISYMSRWKQTNHHHHHHHHNMIKSNSLSELCAISESIKISDCSISSGTSGIKDNSGSSGGRSPVSIVSSSPLSNDKVYLATSSPLRTPQPHQQIYEAPARLSVPSNKKRSLTLSDFNEDQGFVHLENSSYVSTNFIELVKAADMGIKGGQQPYLCDEACGGTYFLRVSLIIILSLTLSLTLLFY